MAKFKVFVKLEGEQQTVGEMYQAPGTILRDELKSFLNRNGY